MRGPPGGSRPWGETPEFEIERCEIKLSARAERCVYGLFRLIFWGEECGEDFVL